MKWTTDFVVGIFLGCALICAIFAGGSSELQTTIASGLIGYMGRVATEKGKEG